MSVCAAVLGACVPTFDQYVPKGDPSAQTARSAEARDCKTEAQRMHKVVKNMPRNELDHAIAMTYVQEAERAAANNDEKGCWDALSKTQSYVIGALSPQDNPNSTNPFRAGMTYMKSACLPRAGGAV